MFITLLIFLYYPSLAMYKHSNFSTLCFEKYDDIWFQIFYKNQKNKKQKTKNKKQKTKNKKQKTKNKKSKIKKVGR